jgi:acetoin utilization protein AcuB
VALAQRKRVGSLLVKENDKIVGIVTTNDFFFGILNPLLGISLPGSRILVSNCFKGPDVAKVLDSLNNLRIGITNFFLNEFPFSGKHDLIIHLDTPDAAAAIEAIKKLGFSVTLRER